MKRQNVIAVLGLMLMSFAAQAGFWNKPEWSMNATIIEACSCPMFCQCYFNASPASHHEHKGKEKHFCKFNNAFQVNKGYNKETKLDGARFWVSGDLGAELTKGQFEWAIVTFDKKTTKEQRDSIGMILQHVYPVKWTSMTTAEADIDKWEAKDGMAHATIDGGKTAEVKLKQAAGNDPKTPVVMQNLKYWGVPRNTGFIMMPNEVEAYRVGPQPFEFKGTNGFMITIDINSKDVEKPTTASLN